MADSRIPADVNEAVYRVVHDFADSKMSGAERLSQQTGTPPGTIYNKSCLTDSGHHKPTLAEGILWTNITGDLRIAQSFSRAVGGVHVDLRGAAEQSDEALLDLILKREEEEGDASRVLGEALADSRISRADFEKIRREEMEAVAARLTVLARVEGMVR